MKKLLAVLLTVAMCVSMAACGGSSQPSVEDTTPPAAENTENVTEEGNQQEEVEETTEYMYLTADQVEEFYQAIVNGEVQGGGIDVVRSLDDETMKLAIDAMAMIFGEEDLLGQIAGFGPQEMDQIMAEVMFIINSASGEEAEDPSASEGGEEFMDEMGTTMTLYDADLDRSIVVEFDPAHAFLEPDWAMITTEPINYFINIDSDYQTYALNYGALNRSTEEIIDMFIHNKATRDGVDATATEIETFTAGGIEWEIFTLVYEKTGTGIDKETGKEVTFTDTVYDVTCFARPDSETALQLETGTSHNADIVEHYKEVVQTSIANITVQ